MALGCAPVELKHGEQGINVVGMVRQELRDAVGVHARLALLEQRLHPLLAHRPPHTKACHNAHLVLTMHHASHWNPTSPSLHQE